MDNKAQGIKQGVPEQRQGAETEEQVRRKYLAAMLIALGIKGESDENKQEIADKQVEKLVKWQKESPASKALWRALDTEAGGEDKKFTPIHSAIVGRAREFLKETSISRDENALHDIGAHLLRLLYEEPGSDLFTKTIRQKLNDWRVSDVEIQKFNQAVGLKQ